VEKNARSVTDYEVAKEIREKNPNYFEDIDGFDEDDDILISQRTWEIIESPDCRDSRCLRRLLLL